MGKHRGLRRPPWWRLPRAYDALAYEIRALRREYERLMDDHIVLVGDLEALRPPPPEPAPAWGLDPVQAEDLVRSLGLTRDPGGRVAQGGTGYTG